MPTADRSGAASGASRLVTEFLQAMAADRGLARNGLAAHRRDLEACLEALRPAGDFTSCAAEDLRGLGRMAIGAGGALSGGCLSALLDDELARRRAHPRRQSVPLDR